MRHLHLVVLPILAWRLVRRPGLLLHAVVPGIAAASAFHRGRTCLPISVVRRMDSCLVACPCLGGPCCRRDQRRPSGCASFPCCSSGAAAVRQTGLDVVVGAWGSGAGPYAAIAGLQRGVVEKDTACLRQGDVAGRAEMVVAAAEATCPLADHSRRRHMAMDLADYALQEEAYWEIVEAEDVVVTGVGLEGGGWAVGWAIARHRRKRAVAERRTSEVSSFAMAGHVALAGGPSWHVLGRLVDLRLSTSAGSGRPAIREVYSHR